MAYTVVRPHPQTGAPTAILAGKPVPAWARDLIHDDDLVKAGEVDSATGPSGPPGDVDSSDGTSGDAGSSGSSDGGGSGADPVEPPRAGRGAGAEAWTAYAAALGITVPDGASRDAVIELVDQHKQN